MNNILSYPKQPPPKVLTTQEIAFQPYNHIGSTLTNVVSFFTKKLSTNQPTRKMLDLHED